MVIKDVEHVFVNGMKVNEIGFQVAGEMSPGVDLKDKVMAVEKSDFWLQRGAGWWSGKGNNRWRASRLLRVSL